MFRDSRSSLVRRITVAASALALLVFTGFGYRTASAADELKVHVSIVLKGHIEGLDEDKLIEIAEHALEAAHIIAEHHGGAGIVELHIEIHANDHDHGFHLAGKGGEWHEDEDADIVDHIDDVLIEMIHHFIDKAQHH